MFVGGCVRNYLKSKKINDIDIATIFTPDELKKKLQNSNFKIIETGLEHGSVTVVLDNKKFNSEIKLSILVKSKLNKKKKFDIKKSGNYFLPDSSNVFSICLTVDRF